MSLEDELRS